MRLPWSAAHLFSPLLSLRVEAALGDFTWGVLSDSRRKNNLQLPSVAAFRNWQLKAASRQVSKESQSMKLGPEHVRNFIRTHENKRRTGPNQGYCGYCWFCLEVTTSSFLCTHAFTPKQHPLSRLDLFSSGGFGNVNCIQNSSKAPD